MKPIILKSTNRAQYIFDISSNNKLNNIETIVRCKYRYIR